MFLYVCVFACVHVCVRACVSASEFACASVCLRTLACLCNKKKRKPVHMFRQQQPFIRVQVASFA